MELASDATFSAGSALCTPPLVREYRSFGRLIFRLTVPALQLSFGHVTSLIGRNGSGKTTLSLALYEALTTGSQTDGIGSNVSLLTQDPDLVFASDLTVHENFCLRLVRARLGNYRKLRNDASAIADLLQRSPIQELFRRTAHQKVGVLSRGEKQQLALGALLLQRPRVLILDEPLASTDAIVTQRLAQAFRDYARQFSAVVVLVTHELSVAREFSDTILVLNNGMLENQFLRNTNWPDDISILKQSFGSGSLNVHA